jgi:hypothetical protein
MIVEYQPWLNNNEMFGMKNENIKIGTFKVQSNGAKGG